MRKITFILIISALIIEGCSTSRRAGTGTFQDAADGDGTVVSDVVRNNISNFGFNINRADIFYSIDGVSGKLVAGVKHKNPDTLLVTIRHSTGIEIGRIFLTSDTILINDRINRRVMYGDPAFLEKRYGIERGMIMVVLGDIIMKDEERNVNNNCQNGVLTIQTKLEDGRINYEIDCKLRKITNTILVRNTTNDRITIRYKNFIKRGNNIVPGTIEIEDLKNKALIRMEIKGVEIPWKGRVDFIYGTRYKFMRIK